MRLLSTMADAAKVIKEYKGSELSQQMDIMLTALIDGYRLDLAEVQEQNLRTLQAQLKQALAIRAVIRGELELPRV